MQKVVFYFNTKSTNYISFNYYYLNPFRRVKEIFSYDQVCMVDYDNIMFTLDDFFIVDNYWDDPDSHPVLHFVYFG